MSTAREILGIQTRSQDLRESANQFLKDYTTRKVTRARDSLQEVARDRSTYSKENQVQTGETYRLFLEHYDGGADTLRSVFDSSRKARRLAWTLCYHGQEGDITIARSRPHLQVALTVIESSWRWSCYFGTFDALLKVWDNDRTRPVLQEFLSRKLEEYEGSRPRLLNLKEYRDAFFRTDGPTQIATSLIKENRPITDVLEMLRLPEHAQGYSYFAALADAYTTSAMRAPSYRDFVRPILKFLDAHGRRVSYKRCLSKIILRLDDDERVPERQNVIQVSFQKVGDPDRDPNWQPPTGATSDEKENLKSAQKTLNNWIAQRFITAFFNKVAMDEDRRRFWLQYTPHMTRFKVYGSRGARRKLQQDERIQKYVDQRFGRVSGGMNALLMQIKDRVIVEFGKVGGACYVHRKGSPDCPSFDKRYNRVSEFQIGTGFPLLMRYSGQDYRDVKSQGRFLHKHDWERRLHWWMRTQLGIEPQTE
ncbi:EH signature domain-containing protein [Salinibacter ruber]|uniref:EH signature domain-containing protein n=1 Tax=Salinibacter ruber TaxID=146919 RepID=UPI0021696564|nr:EH signature domain-containing protein [Salinibacter ruber]MCS4056773.1 hypothetical protein [Salinibacter ruber]